MTVVLDASAILVSCRMRRAPTSSRCSLPPTRDVEQPIGPRRHRRSVALAATGRFRARCWIATGCPSRLSLSQMRSGRRRAGGAVKDSHLVIGCVCRWHIG